MACYLKTAVLPTAASFSNSKWSTPQISCAPLCASLSCGMKKPRSRLIRAQAAGGDEKDAATAVVVHQKRSNNQAPTTTAEQRPRRLAVDISPLGNIYF